MRIISFAAIRNYVKEHADSDVPLRDWYKKTEKADWSCLTDIKQTFNSVDYVGNDRYDDKIVQTLNNLIWQR